MNNVVDFNRKKKETIERRAEKEYGAVKIAENSYLIPSNVAYSEEVGFKEEKWVKEADLKRAFTELEIGEREHISMTFKMIRNNGKRVLELLNSSNGKLAEVEADGDLFYEEREEIVELIAWLNKGKKVHVTFFLNYDYNLLEGLVTD